MANPDRGAFEIDESRPDSELGPRPGLLTRWDEWVNRHKCAIIGGVLTAMFFIALISTLIYTWSSDVPKTTTTTNKQFAFPNCQREIKLADAVGSYYQPKTVTTKWDTTGTKIYFYNDQREIIEMDVTTGIRSTILANDFVFGNNGDDFEVSADMKYVMLRFKQKNHLSHYVVVHLQSRSIYNIWFKPSQAIQLAMFTRNGHEVVFIENNQIYFMSDFKSKVQRVSPETGPEIYNGICDRVFSDVIFPDRKAIWMSAYNFMAYIQFDTTESQKSLPRTYNHRNTTIPTVRLFVANLNSSVVGAEKHLEVTVPYKLAKQHHFITYVEWITPHILVSQWTYRLQDYGILKICNQGDCTEQVREIYQSLGWFDRYVPNYVFDDRGVYMAYLEYTSQTVNNITSEYAHVFAMMVDDPIDRYQITFGGFNAQQILKWDRPNRLLFFLGNEVSTPHQTHLYVVNPIKGPYMKYCLTCEREFDGGVQQVFDVSINRKYPNFVMTNLGPSIPSTSVYTYYWDNSSVVQIENAFLLEDNQRLHAKMENIIDANITYFSVQLNASAPYLTHVKMYAPPNMDTSGKIKYPLLVLVNGAPNEYVGTGDWSIGYPNYLASNQSVVVVQIDGRGAGRRDGKSLFALRRDVGNPEIKDQLGAIRHITTTMPYIDANRVGITGTHYGGYAAAMALAMDKNNTIKCAAAVAPITDWIHQNVIYTERYLGLLEQNWGGYKDSSLLMQAANIRNNSLFLVHSKYDDIVQYQNTMQLAKKLEKHNILFSQATFNDVAYAIKVGSAERMDFYNVLNSFFGECFNMVLTDYSG